MQPLPVIVGFGGYNAAGRSSSHQAFRRMVLESLSQESRQQTITSLACLMSLVSWDGEQYLDQQGNVLNEESVAEQFEADVIAGTLVRRVGDDRFDPYRVPANKRVTAASGDEGMAYRLKRRDLPAVLPSHWRVEDVDGQRGYCDVYTGDQETLYLQVMDEQAAKAAGQLPTGFDPANHYNARFHPRGLQLAVTAASDALHSSGILWDSVMSAVSPDQVGVYGSSLCGQFGAEGFGGLAKNRFVGERSTAKQLPLGLNSMVADFVNAYVLGNLGHTEGIAGACASFLYALHAAVHDIRSGRVRVAMVGNAEGSLEPEIYEGFGNMGALGTDEGLCRLDNSDTPNWRRASRPFGDNCGFTLAEGGQFILLMDDALAIELGADVHGAVPDVFVNADGVKKSISAPGVGNYLSFTRAVASAVTLFGEETVKKHSFIHAHGSSTPANRVTESAIFDRVATTFGISQWPVAAVKSYVGHTIAAASGDQLISALGTFKYNLIPGIKTIDRVADDIPQQHLHFPLQDMDVSAQKMDVAFINSKGFGGNNATAIVASPDRANRLLEKRYGEELFTSYLQRREKTRVSATEYAQRADRAQLDVIYRFGEAPTDEQQLDITTDALSVEGYAKTIQLTTENPWGDLF